MSSAIDVCNMALSHIGAEAQVATIDPPDGSAEAGYCARFYPIARRIAMESHSWTFAKTRATLAMVATNPSSVWLYAYALPSDMVDSIRVLNLATIEAILLSLDSFSMATTNALYWQFLLRNTEQSSADFEIEDGVLLTNEPDAVLIYTKDEQNVANWTPLFMSAVAQLLAGYLAGPIIKGVDGMKVGQAWTQSGLNLLGQAASSDANSTSERSDFVPTSIQARA